LTLALCANPTLRDNAMFYAASSPMVLQQVFKLMRSRKACAPECEVLPDRRTEARAPVFIPAALLIEDCYRIQAVITDLSSNGARVQFTNRMDLPFRVRLHSPLLRVRCWARVVWQTDGAAGLEFQREARADVILEHP
jgi:hypothetical protein